MPPSYRSPWKSKKIITHNKPNFNALATFHHLHNKQLRPGSHDPPHTIVTQTYLGVASISLQWRSSPPRLWQPTSTPPAIE